jgi:hypothetical protein
METRDLYKEAWEHVLHSLQQENMMKTEIMKQPSFDVHKAFAKLTNGPELTRDHLAKALPGLNQPHVDILYAKLAAQSKQVMYADFIEMLSPSSF